MENLNIMRAATTKKVEGSPDYFTGRVTISTPYKGSRPARIGGATVSFDGGARTAWHTHPLGQTLFIISGKGRVQMAGGPIEEVAPGDVVFVPPQTKHWHGADPATPMAHFAVSEALDGSSVTWLEKVSDEDYHCRLGAAVNEKLGVSK
jgi:4-carboxymuconolactone decarboxylase